MFPKGLEDYFNIASDKWKRAQTHGTIEHRFRKIIWGFGNMQIKFALYKYRRRERLHGTHLNKFGRQSLNGWLKNYSPKSKFTIREGMNDIIEIVNKKTDGYKNILKTLSDTLPIEGYIVEVEKNGVHFYRKMKYTMNLLRGERNYFSIEV